MNRARLVHKMHPTKSAPYRRAHSVHLRKTQPAVGCAPCTVRRHKMAGITYMEVLIATLLIVITLVPALEALQPGIAGTGIHETLAEDYYQLTARLEEVLAEPFANLDDAATVAGNSTTPTTYSDVVTYPDGRQITHNVFLSRYDGDNADTDNDPFTGTDEGLLWVRVEIAGSMLSMETLASEYE